MNTSSPQGDAPRHESQSDRWLKYGSNVALSVILVIALAVGLTWFAQRANARHDTTINGSLSLKPQTLAVLKQLKQHVTIVSLYVKPEKSTEEDKLTEAAQAQRVSDLLDEYKGNSANVEVKIIDPAKEKDRLEDLHQDFINRYGSQIKSYRDYLDGWQKDFDQLKKLTDAESAAVSPMVSPDGEETAVSSLVNTISEEVPDLLTNARKGIDHELKQKHPDYKAAANVAKQMMQQISRLAGAISTQAPDILAAKAVPLPFKQYLAKSIPHYDQMKKLADDSIDKGSKLGELKVDQLEQALSVDNPILVLGDSEWRIISKDQVWQADTDLRAVSNNGGKQQFRFAGEQQVTSAIYALENPTKKQICFVRVGNQPFTTRGFPPFIPNGPMSILADRLREYNFDVTEKDLSGQWAARAQMQQMPSAPEPSKEQIKDAIWVVLDLQQGNEQGGPPPSIGPELKEHLDQGGSALILSEVKGESLADALKSWGIEIRPDCVGVHESIKLNESADASWLERAKAQQPVWDVRQYGDHMLAKAANNLDSFIVFPGIVRTTNAPGVTNWPFIPLTMTGSTVWGTTDLENISKQTVEYHADKGDIPSPIFAGAIAEKAGAGRVVVIGSVNSFTDNFMRIYDPKLAQRDPPIRLNRSPGNSEIFTNSIFWLSHLEPMIAISPAAMDVSRIDDMSRGMLQFWRIGVLLIILPGMVLAAGAFVYVTRRD